MAVTFKLFDQAALPLHMQELATVLRRRLFGLFEVQGRQLVAPELTGPCGIFASLSQKL